MNNLIVLWENWGFWLQCAVALLLLAYYVHDELHSYRRQGLGSLRQRAMLTFMFWGCTRRKSELRAAGVCLYGEGGPIWTGLVHPGGWTTEEGPLFLNAAGADELRNLLSAAQAVGEFAGPVAGAEQAVHRLKTSLDIMRVAIGSAGSARAATSPSLDFVCSGCGKEADAHEVDEWILMPRPLCPECRPQQGGGR